MLNTTTQKPIDINQMSMNWEFYSNTEHDLYTVEDGEIVPLTDFEAETDSSDPQSRFEAEAYDELLGYGLIYNNDELSSNDISSIYTFLLLKNLKHKFEQGKNFNVKSVVRASRKFRNYLLKEFKSTLFIEYKLFSAEQLVRSIYDLLIYLIKLDIEPNNYRYHKYSIKQIYEILKEFKHLDLNRVFVLEVFQEQIINHNSKPNETYEILNIFNRMENELGIDFEFCDLTIEEQKFVNSGKLLNQLKNELATKSEQARKQTKI